MVEPLRRESTREEEWTTADLAGSRGVDRPRWDECADDVTRPKPVSAEVLDVREPRASSAFVARQMEDAGTAPTPLFAETDINDLRMRWSNVQAGFVDEPRRAVEDADKLVATAMERLAEGFANERSALERQWSSGDQVSTEDLRVALQRYRSFFDRLLRA
jgi:hypothetical protein